MQIKKNIDNFLANLKGSEKAILLFGPSRAVIDSRLDCIKQKLLGIGFALLRFSYDEIKGDLTCLWEEVASPSLFKTKNLIQLDIDTLVVKAGIFELIEKIAGDSLLIVRAGDLPPNNELRKYFESGADITSIGCYKTETSELKKITSELFAQKKIKASLEMINIITGKYDNLLMLQSDIELLDIWLGEERDLKLTDIDQIFSSNEDFEFMDLAYGVALNNKKRTITIFNEMLYKGIQLISIIRALLNFYHRMYSYLILQDTHGAEAALTKIYPAVFFKEKPDFLKVCAATNKSNIIKIIEALDNMERIIKRADSSPRLCFENFLLHLGETNFIYRHINDCMLAFDD